MNIMEGTVVATENKKLMLLEANLNKYEIKKQQQDHLDEEKKKKKKAERFHDIRQSLYEQTNQKEKMRLTNRELNNGYVKLFQEKVQHDFDQEQFQLEALKQKNKEIYYYQLEQIQERKSARKGMSLDEFDYNKDLLKEIVIKKRNIEDSIS